MTEIRRGRLEKAERELRSIAGRHLGAFKNRDIDWRVIRDQLRRLDGAFQNGDSAVFNEALEMLVTRLGPPNTLRGHIGSDPEERLQAMPPQVLELINHMVDRLDSELTLSSDSPNNDDGRNQLGSGDRSEK